MLTVIAKSVGGGESEVTGTEFFNISQVTTYVAREFRGLSSLYAVTVTHPDRGVIAYGHRAGPNGTGESWAWNVR